jgi:DNA topoisomerase-1
VKNLVIVESVTKTKTLKKYLGKDYEILASYGHVRDLLPKTGAVDVNDNFHMNYQLIEKNKKHVDAIVKAVKAAETLYLATDPDREGEAIAWHLLEILKSKKLLKNLNVHRVAFNEITKNAVAEAIKHPREISMPLVDAQQARRALDYLVGFNLSPLLWKKIRRGLSAGRVQSPALRMICEREEEIEKFISQEYWTIAAECQFNKVDFLAKLVEYQGEKLKQFSFTNADQTAAARDALLKLANGKLTVSSVEKKQRKRNPAAPFTTSTLQQEAARKCGFTTRKTMQIAQQLYEGINIGDGPVGLITYMRTDSVALAQEAVGEIRQFITENYGFEALPEAPRVYKTKAKNAQEAHEAVRPTSVFHVPEKIKSHLTPDQFKLYQLIWQRAIACQMAHALFDQVTVELQANEKNTFRVTGATLVKPGFLSVYEEGLDDPKKDEEDESKVKLPALKEGDVVTLNDIKNEQHFTEPPPRYSEASLVKALEEYGIGRPSTYASIISTLQARDYVSLEQKRFYPTDVGKIVNKFLTQHFTTYVDYDFTAKLEDTLDDISRGEKAWIPVMDDFWQPFHHQVDEIGKNVQRIDVTSEKLDEACPKCAKPLLIRLGKSGRFVGCSGYPECDYTRNVDESHEEAQALAEKVEGRQCPECQGDLVYKRGKFGRFIGCGNYPECKYIESLTKTENTGVTCPSCHQGMLTKRKSRFGTFFYSCNKYPDCKYIVNHEPVAKVCPKCKWPIMMKKTTKRRGTELVCAIKTCGHAEPFKEE